MAKRAKTINKLLIANRGEIAVRVAKACRELSIPTVAVYSTADRSALHVRSADHAVCIGEPEAIKSYLNIDAVIGAAKRSGADAIHPGYGFLSENPSLAERCRKEGITFIGPSPEATRLVGDKITARQTARKNGVPITPGMVDKTEDVALLKTEAIKIGYPLMIKASAGGGGKGMRIVRSAEEMEEAASTAIRTAASAFGNGAVYLEKFVENPRHIEFQIAADRAGNVVHLHERECSIQRRHQKLVEETPSTALDDKLRKAMGECAVGIAKACGYDSVGTVEFMLDEDGKFYFMEVNARIQVEHPVTEMAAGIDLVKKQIRIAAGEPLALTQGEVKPRGHAIECRIYAEDPENNFTPSPGKILLLREPSGPGVRVDSGIYEGYEVPPYYDPILSKTIVWSEDRAGAIAGMSAALRNYIVLGVKTTAGFLARLVDHPKFREGALNTNFIQRHAAELKAPPAGHDTAIAAALFKSLKRSPRGAGDGGKSSAIASPWQTMGNTL